MYIHIYICIYIYIYMNINDIDLDEENILKTSIIVQLIMVKARYRLYCTATYLFYRAMITEIL
jgi:hypothetical protein